MASPATSQQGAPPTPLQHVVVRLADYCQLMDLLEKINKDDASLLSCYHLELLVPRQRHRRHRAAHRRLEEREEHHVRGPGGAAASRLLIGRQCCAVFADCMFEQIRPEQVCTPTDPGPVFIVVECPSEAFVEAVCCEQQLSR